MVLSLLLNLQLSCFRFLTFIDFLFNMTPLASSLLADGFGFSNPGSLFQLLPPFIAQISYHLGGLCIECSHPMRFEIDVLVVVGELLLANLAVVRVGLGESEFLWGR